MIRKDYNDQIFRTENEKNNAIIKKIVDCHNLGQPILIFTSSINKSEIYSNLTKFKQKSSLIITNRMHKDLIDVVDKVFTRDLFGEN